MSTPPRSPFIGAATGPIHIDGTHQRAVDTLRNRLLVIGIMFALAFIVVAGRLVDLAAIGPSRTPLLAQRASGPAGRADIFDRHGVILATSLPTASLYADPKEILDPEETTNKLARVLPGLDRERLLAKLTDDSRFEWIRRNLTPEEQFAVNRLGLPGLAFRSERRRVYPRGRAAAHIVGYTDIDGRGLAGIERSFDGPLSRGKPVRLSIDLRIQHIVREELAATMREFRGVGGVGVVLDAATGELLASVSLPDFDPNDPGDASAEARFNRVVQGVYEMGSTFKLFTAAMALDSGVTTLEGGYDASKPIRVARYTIRDYHAENRWLSVPEILVHSSNIGAALMALDVGGPLQRKYLDRLGLLAPAAVELSEVGKPLKPAEWRDINTMTIGFGHGIAISPVQLVAAVAAVADGGVYRPPTVVHRDGPPLPGRRVISARTSRSIRALMRLVVLRGTGRKADVPGLRLGGKTGTAEKLVGGRYRRDKRISSFVGAFPINAPRYVVLMLVDEPKGTARTYNYATGGWVAAPAVGRVAARIAPLLGVEPVPGDTGPARRSPRQNKTPLFVAVKQALRDARGWALAAN